MANGRNALLCPLPAARAERIGSHIDVRAVVVLMRKPGEITRGERLIQRDDALLRRGWILPAQQESNRLTRREATGEKVGGDSIHGISPQRNAYTGISREVEARRLPGFYGKAEGAYAASSSVGASSSSGDALAARSSLRIELTRISQMVCSEFVFLLSYFRLRSSPSTWI